MKKLGEEIRPSAKVCSDTERHLNFPPGRPSRNKLSDVAVCENKPAVPRQCVGRIHGCSRKQIQSARHASDDIENPAPWSRDIFGVRVKQVGFVFLLLKRSLSVLLMFCLKFAEKLDICPYLFVIAPQLHNAVERLTDAELTC